MNRIEKFWNSINVLSNEDCWEWKGYTKPNGYGNFNFEGKKQKASRLAWKLTHGDPGQFWVLHKCDNRKCCNPNHLFLGTAKDNTQDMMRKGRGKNREGEAHGRAKLTAEQVLNIRARLKQGECDKTLAEEFNVCRHTITLIHQRKRWKHI